DAYAPPDRRGHGAFGLVLDFIFQRLHGAGFTRAYSYVRGDAPLGLAGARRRLRPVGKLWYLRVHDRSLVFGRRGKRAAATAESGRTPAILARLTERERARAEPTLRDSPTWLSGSACCERHRRVATL
ncbi:MAG: hypothetical protein ACRDHY_12940, partial [Anaerolineales bacterium]